MPIQFRSERDLPDDPPWCPRAIRERAQRKEVAGGLFRLARQKIEGVEHGIRPPTLKRRSAYGMKGVQAPVAQWIEHRSSNS
jgi:hypothetical protein